MQLSNIPSKSQTLRRCLGLTLFALGVLPAATFAAVPPPPSQTTFTGGVTVNGKNYAAGPFTLTTSSAGAHHFKVCRSVDTTGWGGCDVILCTSCGASYTVSGTDLPSEGYRRAYYFSACDASNACTRWADNVPTYVQMDTTGPGAPGATTTVPACKYVSSGCWQTGSFTITATPASDSGSGVNPNGYWICRSNDTSGWGGCNVTLTQSGGTSYTIGGSNLPADGSRRAYYFRAKDYFGTWGSWNTPVHVRVDRYDPTVSADNASTIYFISRQANVSAGDGVGGAAANSGLAAVRYRWNGTLDAGCTLGTVTSDGAALSVPVGDNWLYLCARDRTGRVTTWNGGPYRVNPAVPLAIIADHGDMLGFHPAYHQEVGYSNGSYFMLVQVVGQKAGCTAGNDQVVLLTAGSLFGPWSPRGGSYSSARVTPCDTDPDFGVTNWGIGSLWQRGSTWYLTLDAGHGGDSEKRFVYLIQSSNGIDWPTVTLDRRIIDGTPTNQLILYTTVIPTDKTRVGFFYWTGTGTYASGLGYGQIELAPGPGDPNGVAVYLLDTAGVYRLLPEDGAVDFDLMHVGPTGNPLPGDALLTSGVSGVLFTHRAYILPGLYGCPTAASDQKVTELQTSTFSLNSVVDPQLVLCNSKLCDQSPVPIVEGPANNPRNGSPGIIQADVFRDLDGRSYLLASVDTECHFTFWWLRPRLYELNF